jgi:hypothetical protein
LQIREVDSEGFEGALLRVPGRSRGIIAVRRDISELARKRFTIAHEIGHYVLPGHGSVNAVCTHAEIELDIAESQMREKSANRFASELLLPRALVVPLIQERGISIKTAKHISKLFQVSLTATAMKCVESSDQPCALVISVGNVVARFYHNALFDYRISLGWTLRSDTKAYFLSEHSDDMTDTGEVPATAWLDRQGLQRDVMITEDSIFLPNYDQVLTILVANRMS